MTVEHEQSQHRFVVHAQEGQGELRYARPDAHTIDLQHTVVSPALQGHGVADALATAAFEYARASHLRVIPTCPYVRQWLTHHPEQSDVLVVN